MEKIIKENKPTLNHNDKLRLYEYDFEIKDLNKDLEKFSKILSDIVYDKYTFNLCSDFCNNFNKKIEFIPNDFKITMITKYVNLLNSIATKKSFKFKFVALFNNCIGVTKCDEYPDSISNPSYNNLTKLNNPFNITELEEECMDKQLNNVEDNTDIEIFEFDNKVRTEKIINLKGILKIMDIDIDIDDLNSVDNYIDMIPHIDRIRDYINNKLTEYGLKSLVYLNVGELQSIILDYLDENEPNKTLFNAIFDKYCMYDSTSDEVELLLHRYNELYINIDKYNIKEILDISSKINNTLNNYFRKAINPNI